MISRDDGRFQRELITNNLDHPLGIAVDAVNRFFIFTRFQSVCLLKFSKSPTTPPKPPTNYSSFSRKIYWTNAGNQPKIETSNLDGSQRQIVINNDLGQPNHLVIDYRRRTLCWSDSKLQRAECMALNGSARRTILSIQGSIFGLSVFQVNILICIIIHCTRI